MRRLLVVAAAASLTGCSVGEGLAGNSSSLARTSVMAMNRDSVAALLAAAPKFPAERELFERWAFRWVEFALLAERLADGDSLLDSATVMRAMWTDANQWLVDYYHERLMGERVQVTDAVLDSAYRAGNHRIFDHILVRTSPNMSPPELEAARRKADRLHALLADGKLAEANEENDDPVAKRAGGRTVALAEGEREPAFDTVAFALEPGELADLFETKAGFHVLQRPPLEAVRTAFEEDVADILMVRMDSVILDEIQDRWRVRVGSNAPVLMREAASAPLRAFQTPKKLGSHRGGDFTTADFIRWLQAMPGVVFQNVPGATDDQLENLLTSLIRNEALVAAAIDAGMELPPEDMTELRERLREQIDGVRVGIGLDSAVMSAPTREARLAAASNAISDYLERLSQGMTAVVVVPSFLAQVLREDMAWDVSQTAVDEGLERLVALRQQRLMPEGVDARPDRAPAAESGDSAP